MKFRVLIYLVCIVGIFSFSSCEKQAGKGGSSTIRGRVMIKEYNRDFTFLKDTIPMQNEDVFIIYGDQEIYGDRFKTDYDGYYEFTYLQTGSYRIFTYSKDSTLNYDITDALVPLFRDVQITDENQTVNVEDIYILK